MRGRIHLSGCSGIGYVLYSPSFCGYDVSGDLFVVGSNGGSEATFGEVASGSKQLTQVNVNDSLGRLNNVQFDGSFVAVSDAKYARFIGTKSRTTKVKKSG